MGNIFSMSCRKKITSEKLVVQLQEINTRRFLSKFIIKQEENVWYFSFAKQNLFSLILSSEHKIQTKHARQNWAFWVQSVFMNELALHYKGRLSDEGIEGSWTGDVKKYPTIQSWYGELVSIDKDDPLFTELFNLNLRLVPDFLIELGIKL